MLWGWDRQAMMRGPPASACSLSHLTRRSGPPQANESVAWPFPIDASIARRPRTTPPSGSARVGSGGSVPTGGEGPEAKPT